MRIRSLIVRVLSVTALLAIPACGTAADQERAADPEPSQAENEGRERTDERTPDPSESPWSPDPGRPGEPDPSDPGQPDPPAPDPDALISIDWVQPRPASENATRLRVHYQLPTPCSPGLRAAAVEETASTVTISLHREPDSAKDDSMECAQVVVNESTTVELRRPLGERTVADASSGDSVRIGE